MNIEDEDESSHALYDDGHWGWGDDNELKFISHLKTESSATLFMPITKVGQAEFRDELDVIEQQRYKKGMQRRSSGTHDIIMLQDVKDFALYSAPPTLLTTLLIDVLHTRTTERFLRALILYCQYFIQISEEMEFRNFERKTKIPTPNSYDIEATFQENLNDLRLLVAKEYCTMIIGGDDFKKFHHMGKDKKSKSMSTKEAMIFEPLIRISVQIVWIALARKKYNLIELEVNRLFRSSKFNLIEHKLGSNLDSVISAGDRRLMQRQCATHETMNNVKSPFYNEVACDVDGDFRMLGLGVIKYDNLNERLSHLKYYLTADENTFQRRGISLGIIGQSRSQFDTLLRQILSPIDDPAGRSSGSSAPRSSGSSAARSPASSAHTIGIKATVSKRVSRLSQKSANSKQNLQMEMYPAINLPKKCSVVKTQHYREFPSESLPPLAINKQQYAKWTQRVSKRTALRRQTIEVHKRSF